MNRGTSNSLPKMPLPWLNDGISLTYSIKPIYFLADSKIYLETDMPKPPLPLNWWTQATNFGDALSPWLAARLYNGNVVYKNGKKAKTFLAIGSVISKATSKTIVWGSGGFGTENLLSYSNKINTKAVYKAVRGPLTRNLLRISGVSCPEIYGDPALLLPYFYYPEVQKTYEVGIILRWSEKKWNNLEFGEGIKKIFFGTDKIEETIQDILSCKKIISSSLHGIILADAYNIPNAWLDTTTTKGYNFKFYDYMLSVNKIQKPQKMPYKKFKKLSKITLHDIYKNFAFDKRKIDIDLLPLVRACPFADNDIVKNLKRKIKTRNISLHPLKYALVWFTKKIRKIITRVI